MILFLTAAAVALFGGAVGSMAGRWLRRRPFMRRFYPGEVARFR